MAGPRSMLSLGGTGKAARFGQRAGGGGRPLGFISRGRLRWGRGEGCWGGRAREINLSTRHPATKEELALEYALPAAVHALVWRHSRFGRRRNFKELARGNPATASCKKCGQRGRPADVTRNYGQNNGICSPYRRPMERLLIARVLSAIGMLCQGRSVHLVRLGRRLGLKWKIRFSPALA